MLLMFMFIDGVGCESGLNKWKLGKIIKIS